MPNVHNGGTRFSVGTTALASARQARPRRRQAASLDCLAVHRHGRRRGCNDLVGAGVVHGLGARLIRFCRAGAHGVNDAPARRKAESP